MRIAYLRRTDGQTDRDKSALVELRFAAKKLELSAFFVIILSGQNALISITYVSRRNLNQVSVDKTNVGPGAGFPIKYVNLIPS